MALNGTGARWSMLETLASAWGPECGDISGPFAVAIQPRIQPRFNFNIGKVVSINHEKTLAQNYESNAKQDYN